MEPSGVVLLEARPSEESCTPRVVVTTERSAGPPPPSPELERPSELGPATMPAPAGPGVGAHACENSSTPAAAPAASTRMEEFSQRLSPVTTSPGRAASSRPAEAQGDPADSKRSSVGRELSARPSAGGAPVPVRANSPWQARAGRAKLQALAFVHHHDYIKASPRSQAAKRLQEPGSLVASLQAAEASEDGIHTGPGQTNAQIQHMLRLHPSGKNHSESSAGSASGRRSPCARLGCLSKVELRFLLDNALMPYLPGKELWDHVLLVLAFYLLVTVPVMASFQSEAPRHPEPSMMALMWTTDVFFLADVAVCSRTSFVSDAGNLVTSLPAIRRRYAHTWLAPDLVSAIPWDLVPLLYAGGSSAGEPGDSYWQKLAADPSARVAWRVMLILRLLRLFKFVRYYLDFVRHFGNTDRDNRILSVSVLGSLLLLIHWFACFWPFVDGFDAHMEGQTRRPLDDYMAGLVASTMMIFGEAGIATSSLGRLFEVTGLIAGGLIISCVYAAVTTQLAQAARRQLQHREHQHLTRETMRRRVAQTAGWPRRQRAPAAAPPRASVAARRLPTRSGGPAEPPGPLPADRVPP